MHTILLRQTFGTAAGRARQALATLLLWRACLSWQWAQRRAQRRALARLESHLLRDVGLSAAEATREAAKPFWRA